jgi:hypothetical protein
MFGHWEQFAIKESTRFGLTHQQTLRAHEIVRSAMGTAWIDEQTRLNDLQVRDITDVHPLYRALVGRTEICMVDVLETAAYLLAFRNDPKIGELIQSLRVADKYQAAMFEAALAWRFREAGALVSLAPVTVGGVADFEAVIDGHKYDLEASTFPLDLLRTELIGFCSAVQRALKAGLKRFGPQFNIALEIEVSGESQANLQREMHGAVLTVMKSYRDEAPPYSAVVLMDFPFGRVAVRPAGPAEQPDLERWSMASCLTLVPRSERDLVGEADYKQGRDSHWVYVNWPQSTRNPYPRIAKKLRNEYRQVRGSPGAVIALQINGLQCGVLRSDDGELASMVESFSRHHSTVGDIWILTKTSSPGGLSSFAGPKIATGNGAYALPPPFVRRFEAVDGSVDIVSVLRKP